MAGLQSTTPQPTDIVLHGASKTLEIAFDNGQSFRLPFELMRVFSPSAEVQGHGPGQEVLQTGKRHVGILSLEPVGNYGVQPTFSDGHNSGIFSWDYLHFLGVSQDRLWVQYEQRLQQAGVDRDAPMPPPWRPGLPLIGQHMASTDFGFKTVDEQDKARRVRGVFDSVASKYDIMNDLMSMGLHRAWKAYTVMVANLKPGNKVLDIAGGTGDMAMAFAEKVGAGGQVAAASGWRSPTTWCARTAVSLSCCAPARPAPPSALPCPPSMAPAWPQRPACASARFRDSVWLAKRSPIARPRY